MKIKFLGVALILLMWITQMPALAVKVTNYRVYEVSLAANNAGSNPYLDGPYVTATFTGLSGEAKGKIVTVNGFWDGNSTWKIRFSPEYAGKWSYTTKSSDSGLDKKSGTIAAVGPSRKQLSGNSFAIFLPGGGSTKLNLSGVSGTFEVTGMDINTGIISNPGSISGGDVRTINSGDLVDTAILVVPAGSSTTKQ